MNTKKNNTREYSSVYRNLAFEHTQVEYRKKLVKKQIEKYNPSTLLEVGCGLSPIFTEVPSSTQITVIEPSKEFVELASSIAGDNITIVNNYLELAELKNTFDFIVVSALLHEIPDREVFLKEIFKYCHDETIVHFNVPNKNSLHRLLAVSMGLIKSADEISENQIALNLSGIVFDLSSLTTLLKKCNFQEIESGSLFVKPFSHKQMQQLVDDSFFSQAMLDGLDDLALIMPDYGSEVWVNVKPLSR